MVPMKINLPSCRSASLSAIALAHDWGEADEWFRFVAATYPAVFPPWGDEEGGWCQGVGYWKWSVPFAWWFIDAPESIMRFKQSVTEMAGFSRISGMIDDTRAFCSIPARHDMMRRLDAAHLANLVAVHRLDEDEAIAQAIKLVDDNPKKVFNL